MNTLDFFDMISDFLILLAEAQASALLPREQNIFGLRYGLTGEKPRTLAHIGKHIGVSRERIRQILNRCHKKILSRGIRKTDSACVDLLNYLKNEVVKVKDENFVNRLVEFTVNELSYLPVKTHAIKLITHLVLLNKRDFDDYVDLTIKAFIEQRRARWQIYKQQKLSKKFGLLFDDVIWPDNPNVFVYEDFNKFQRVREVAKDGEGFSGTFFSKKLNRDIQYESEIEQEFLEQLDGFDEIIFYQEQPFVVDYEIQGQGRKYYPDIFFVLKDGRGVVVEIKPIFYMALQSNLKKWSGLRKFCKDKGFGLLITDGRRTFQDVFRYPIRREFEFEVLKSIEEKTVLWKDYQKIKEKFNPTRDEFIALILKHKLIWFLGPFTLSKKEI